MQSYDLELNKAIKLVKKHKARAVLVQLPDGLKPQAKEVVDFIENQTNAKVLIWLGTCYGGCDLPWSLNGKVDLVIQFGHNRFVKTSGWKK